MGARRTGSIIACLVLAGLAPSPSAGEAVPGAGRIVATYDAGLAGINLGEFTVTAAYSPSAYEMAADGRFSLLAGLLYKATGKTTSNGRLTNQPRYDAASP